MLSCLILLKNGYNMTPGGETNPSFVPEIVAKRTDKLLHDPIVNAKMSFKGETNPRAQYTEEDVYAIRQRRMNGERLSDVYEDFKHRDGNTGARNGFSSIWLHESWQNILPEYQNRYPAVNTKHYAMKSKNLLTEEDLQAISQQMQTISKQELYQIYKTKIDWNSFQKLYKQLQT